MALVIEPRRNYSILVMFAALAILGVSGVLYTNSVQRHADHRWCDLLTTIVAPPPESPPPTERQIRAYDQIKELQRELCS